MVFLNKTDRRILIVAVIVLAIFSYFLYDDSLLFPDDNKSFLEKIGKIFKTENDVRVKGATSFSWAPAPQKFNVHQRDSVYTGEGSQVAIELNDGSVINLKENSLVTLNIKNGEMVLDLKYGDIVGDLAANSHLKIKTGKDEYQLNGNEKSVISINKGRGGKLGVKLESGSAALDGAKLTKEKNIIAERGFIKDIPKPHITLITANRTTFTQWTARDAIPLQWAAEPKPDFYLIEVSTDQAFSDIQWKQKTELTTVNSMIESGSGQYFWRVKGLSSVGQVLSISESGIINIVRGGTPSILFPEADKPLVFELPAGTSPTKKVTEFKIKWKAENKISTFNYQIATDPDFKNVIHNEQVNARQITSPALTTGTYFVRVRGEVRPGVFGDWSASRQVDMSVNIAAGPPAPRLISKKVDFDSAEATKRGPSAIQAPQFQWSQSKGADAYKIQISKDKSFKKAQLYSTKGENFFWTDFENGESYFRVFAISKDKAISPPSEVGVVNIILRDPKIKPIKKLFARGKDSVKPAPTLEALVSWTPVPSAKKYILEMDRSNEFSKPQKFEVKGASLPVAVSKPGRFNLRVRALNEKGEPVSNYSQVENLIYVYQTPLLTPRLLEPFDKITLFMQRNTAPYLWLEWQQVPNVSEYLVELSTKPDFSKPFLSAKTIVPRFLVKQKVPHGKLFWRVRALSENPDMHSKWTTNREFSILFNKNETFQ